MEAYQERVIAQKKELDERGDKLEQFILSDRFVTLPAAEQERMKKQLEIMGEYSEVLGERIAAMRPNVRVSEPPNRVRPSERVSPRCPQCGKPIETPVARAITQRDNRSPRGIRTNLYDFCSDQCGAHYQMGCEG